MPGREDEDYDPEMEDRLVNEEYKIWKRNTPFLYGERDGRAVGQRSDGFPRPVDEDVVRVSW